MPQGLDGITVEFKEFGVGLQFLPVVLGSGRVNLKLNISVSELTGTNNVVLDGARHDGRRFLVPSLSKRSASATVELVDGQTIGIAGLINENLREVVNKFPGLGSIPVLGNLFRSQEFLKGETELVILVTPRLARPIPKDQIRLPTDDFIEPNAQGVLSARPHRRQAPTAAATRRAARGAKRRRRRSGLRPSDRVTRGESNMNSHKTLSALVGLAASSQRSRPVPSRP